MSFERPTAPVPEGDKTTEDLLSRMDTAIENFDGAASVVYHHEGDAFLPEAEKKVDTKESKRMSGKMKGVLGASVIGAAVATGYIGNEYMHSDKSETPPTHSDKMPETAPATQPEVASLMPDSPKVDVKMVMPETAPATQPDVKFEIPATAPSTQPETQPATQPEATSKPAVSDGGMEKIFSGVEATTQPTTTQPEASTQPEVTTQPATQPEASTQPEKTPEKPEVKNGKVPPSFEGTAKKVEDLMKNGFPLPKVPQMGYKRTETTRSAAKATAEASTQHEKQVGATTQPEKTKTAAEIRAEKKIAADKEKQIQKELKEKEKEAKEKKAEIEKKVGWAIDMLEQAKADLPKLKTQNDAKVFLDTYPRNYLNELNYPTKGQLDTVKVYDLKVKKRFLNSDQATALAENAEQMEALLLEVCSKYGLEKEGPSIKKSFDEVVAKAKHMATYEYQQSVQNEREREKKMEEFNRRRR